MASNVPTVEDVKGFLNKTTKFYERKQYASTLISKFKNDTDKFRELVNELCDNEIVDPKVDKEKREESKTDTNEEDFEEIDIKDAKEDDEKKQDYLEKILPSSKSKVAKNHHIHFAGLLAATASNKCKDILYKQIKDSPSIMFKRFLIVNYVKQEKEDEPLISLVTNSVPFVQKTTIGALLKGKRKKILDQLADICLKKIGPDFVARFIHGCSQSVCEKLTAENRGILESDKIINSWYRLARFQPNLVLRESEKILKYEWEKTVYLPNNFWRNPIALLKTCGKKQVLDELLQRDKSISEKILLLVQKYPEIEYYGYKNWLWKFDDSIPRKYVKSGFDINVLKSNPGYVVRLPEFVNQHFDKFQKRHPELMSKLLESTFGFDSDGLLRSDNNFVRSYPDESRNAVQIKEFKKHVGLLLDVCKQDIMFPETDKPKDGICTRKEGRSENEQFSEWKNAYKSPYDSLDLVANWNSSCLNPDINLKRGSSRRPMRGRGGARGRGARGRGRKPAPRNMSDGKRDAIKKFWSQFKKRGKGYQFILEEATPHALSGCMSINELKELFLTVCKWFRNILPNGKSKNSLLRRLEWCNLSNQYITKWYLFCYKQVKKYRELHGIKDAKAEGPYGDFLILIHKEYLLFISIYEQFPFKQNHNKRLKQLNDIYNEAKKITFEWKNYMKEHYHDIPTNEEVHAAKTLRNITYSFLDEIEPLSDDEDDNEFVASYRIYDAKKKIRKYKTKKAGDNETKHEYDSEDDDDDLDDIHSKMSDAEWEKKLKVNARYMNKNSIKKLVFEDSNYVNDSIRKWNLFSDTYKTEKVKIDKICNDIETRDKIKKRYFQYTKPLLQQLADFTDCLESMIEYEIQLNINLDRFVQVLINKIFTKCSEFKPKSIEDFVFNRLDITCPKKIGNYSFQEAMYKKICNEWIYYLHSYMRKLLQYSETKDMIYEANGWKVAQSTYDRYANSMNMLPTTENLNTILNVLKDKVPKRSRTVQSLSLYHFILKCIKYRELTNKQVIKTDTCKDLLQYFIDYPKKIYNKEYSTAGGDNESDFISEDAQNEFKMFDIWRNDVYQIYGNYIEKLVNWRNNRVELRADSVKYDLMPKNKQVLLEEDIRFLPKCVDMLFDAWSKHLVTYMHQDWDTVYKRLNSLYVAVTKNAKAVAKIGTAYERELRDRKERELKEDVQVTDDGEEKESLQQQEKKRNEREFEKKSERLLQGLKSLKFLQPRNFQDIDDLVTKWLNFCAKYSDESDDINKKKFKISDTSNLTFSCVRLDHVKEFYRIRNQCFESANKLNTIFETKEKEYLEHIIVIMNCLPTMPKLILRIITELLPKFVNMNDYIEKKNVRKLWIELINKAFILISDRREQLSLNPELKLECEKLDKIITSLFDKSFGMINDIIKHINEKIENGEVPKKPKEETFEDIIETFSILSVTIMKYCPSNKFNENFSSKILLSNELISHITNLMKYLNENKRYNDWIHCFNCIMDAKDELINPDRSKHTSGTVVNKEKERMTFRRGGGRGRGRGRGRARSPDITSRSPVRSQSPLAIVRTGKSLQRFDIDDFAIDILSDMNITTEQKKLILKSICKFAHIRFLTKKNPNMIVQLFSNIFDDYEKVDDEMREIRDKRLEWLLDEEAENTSEKIRDQLLKYQDISNPKLRKKFNKKADSGLDAERENALKDLIVATTLCTDNIRKSQLKTTLYFFAKKLKNESIERRKNGIKILFDKINNFDELLLNNECRIKIFEMLEDCFEVQDLDVGETNTKWINISKHGVFCYFYNLSLDAIELGCKKINEYKDYKDNELFNFGVELQWRMCQYRLGTTDGTIEFRIDLGDIKNRGTALYEEYERKLDIFGSVLKTDKIELKVDKTDVITTDDDEKEKEKKLLKRIFFKEEQEEKFVNMYFDAYEKRVKHDNDEFMKTTKNEALYFKDLFDVLGRNWKKKKKKKKIKKKS